MDEPGLPLGSVDYPWRVGVSHLGDACMNEARTLNLTVALKYVTFVQELALWSHSRVAS
ncbi:hypothetical protein GCM10011504_57920 [Siccirubricoccus deserti]|nr:hypothetical protein GCM10011504_57920 [Siccirubricoccus deserti]